MGNLADSQAEAEKELASAKDALTVAELHVDQLQAYYDGGTSYATYPSDADISKEFDVRNAAVRDSLARVAVAQGRLKDIQAQLRAQQERQKAAESAKTLAAENEKKRQEELKKKPELKREKPTGPEFTPG